MNKNVLSALLVFCAANANAHIVLETPIAQAGSSYRAVLKVGHGCEGSATTQIVVKVPDGVQGAKPMPKAGWRLEIERTALVKPYMSHGRTVTEDVSEIRWTAKSADDYLANAYYDEFVIVGKLPEASGTIYWKVSQICEQGRIDWVDIPGANAASISKTPAAVLEIKQGAADPHAHAH
jgi:uncharacterized protein YcnI